MLNQISYFYIGPMPLIAYGGIVTLLLLLATGIMQFTNRKGWTKVPLKFHKLLAYITIFFGVIHGLMGILAYF
jgi:hypothetical protein